MDDFIKVPRWVLEKIPEIGTEAFAVYCIALSAVDGDDGVADLGKYGCYRVLAVQPANV